MIADTNYFAQELIALLEAHQVSKAVISPGSRNVPLIHAALSSTSISCEVVIDERSAAFVALGFAMTAQSPVAIICTSGSAMLNYAPAIAEAYYRHAPIIVITADRPLEWIDQDDSQTIRQPFALDNYVWRSYNIPWIDSKSYRWYANRIFNEALLFAKNESLPVHINIQINNPAILPDSASMPQPRVIELLNPPTQLSVGEMRKLGATIGSPKKVMIICGFMAPDKKLNQALMKISALPNVVILTETISNLHGKDFITSIDVTLNALPEEKTSYLPDVVITVGGAIVSRHIKTLLRNNPPKEHWHIGHVNHIIDCFMSVTHHIDFAPALFFQALASAMQPHRQDCDYSHLWNILKDKANSRLQSFVNKSPWCDLKCFATLLPMIPRRWNVQYSNGTPIRYAQMFGDKQYHHCDCNRGVSGIDGSTSTAIGASLAYKSDVTLLITGDMSFQYDIGALSINAITPLFKIIVIDNGGGAIFHFIDSTRNLDIKNEIFESPMHLPIRELASAYHFAYFEANDASSLKSQFDLFAKESESPAILRIITNGGVSADILHEFYKK